MSAEIFRQKKARYLFDPSSKIPFRLSRSRLENFLSCPRCFYLDRRLGIEPPGMPAFTLNSAVDELLKKEFDIYRRMKKAHPLMERFGVRAIPWAHPLLEEWRQPFKGISYHHPSLNVVLYGAVDDLWVDEERTAMVVDYKATCSQGPVSLEGPYRQAYKRQMEVYQWLLRRQGFVVSETGYFVYCNGNKSLAQFDSRLEFSIEIIPYHGRDSWVEEALSQALACLTKDSLPNSSPDCGYCHYRQRAHSKEEESTPEPEAGSRSSSELSIIVQKGRMEAYRYQFGVGHKKRTPPLAREAAQQRELF